MIETIEPQCLWHVTSTAVTYGKERLNGTVDPHWIFLRSSWSLSYEFPNISNQGDLFSVGFLYVERLLPHFMFAPAVLMHGPGFDV